MFLAMITDRQPVVGILDAIMSVGVTLAQPHMDMGAGVVPTRGIAVNHDR